MIHQKLLLFVSMLLCCCIAFSQERTITGKITDEKQVPVAGASVKIKGTSTATSTNSEGNFTIKAKSRTVTLLVSSIGFSNREVVVGEGSGEVSNSLTSNSKQLGEVVVTALGIQRQARSLVYATQTIKPGQLTEVRDPNNMLNSLQGKVANVSVTQGSGGPGSGARIVLRGNKSIQGDNNALIMIDGVPMNNTTLIGGYLGSGGATNDFGSVQGSDGASNINPDDIESVNVLRGASAAALYGSQAANGVIVITTKKGRVGTSSVVVNSGIAFEKPFALPEFQNSYGQGNGGIIGDSVGDSWGAKMTGQSYVNYKGKNDSYSAQPNNVKDFFRTGLSLNNSVSFSAGSPNAQTYVSYTNNDINGIIPRNNLMRHTITVRESNQIGKKIFTDAKVTYISQTIKNKPRTGEENAPVIDVYQAPRNISTALMKQYEVLDNLNIPNPTFWPSTLSSIYQNPYWMINRTAMNEARDRIIGFASVKWQITPWLSVKGDANLDRSFDRLEQQYSQGTILWASQAGGYYSRVNAINTQKWFDAILEGTNTLTKDLKLTYHAGAIYQDIIQDYTYNTADGLNVTNKFSMNFATSPATNASYVETQIHSVFGQATFSWKDAVYLDASLRNDWDSRIPSPFTYQYPSVGASAIFSELFQLPKAISFLKGSINCASVGNGGKPQILTATYDYSQGSGNGFISRNNTYAIPNLKPEITHSIEFGADVKFFDDRYGISATFYNSHSYNQLLQIKLPVATGYLYKYINAGDIRNRGLEIILNATPIKSRDLTWDIAVNLSLNRNKIIRLDPDVKIVYLGGNTGFGRSGTPIVQEGGSYGDLLAFKWQRDSKGNLVVDSAGKPVSTADQEYLGNFTPREIVGMTNTINYKRFSLRVLVDGRIGGIMVSGTEMNLAFSGITKATEKYREGGWSLGGVDAGGTHISKTISAQDFWQIASGKRYGLGEFFTYSATNLRVRELSLGYDIPLGTGLFIKSAHISAVARNLFWLYRGKSTLNIPGLGTRKMWMDPDMGLGNTNYQGVEYGTLPSSRTLGFDLKLTF